MKRARDATDKKLSDKKLGRGEKLSIDSAAYLVRIYKVLCDYV